jgi:hypothetical protein
MVTCGLPWAVGSGSPGAAAVPGQKTRGLGQSDKEAARLRAMQRLPSADCTGVKIMGKQRRDGWHGLVGSVESLRTRARAGPSIAQVLLTLQSWWRRGKTSL